MQTIQNNQFETDEITSSGLTVEKASWIEAPMVAECFIPANLKGVLKKEDIAFLAKSAYADACRPGNPRDVTVKEIERLYKSLA